MKRKKPAPTKGLTDAEAEKLGTLIAKARFPLPRPVFDGWVENLPHAALELGIVRESTEGPQIFMKQRPPDDKHWPLLWYVPGTLIRQNESINDAYERLVTSEIGKHLEFGLGPLQFVGIQEFLKGNGVHQCRRGHEIALIHTVRFAGNIPCTGTWHTFARLPESTIGFHRTIVDTVRKSYMQ